MLRPTSDIRRDLESRLQNVNLYHVTKVSLKMSFTVHYNCTEISRFMPVLSIRIVSVSCFYLLISILRISHLGFAVNVALSLSIAVK